MIGPRVPRPRAWIEAGSNSVSRGRIVCATGRCFADLGARGGNMAYNLQFRRSRGGRPALTEGVSMKASVFALMFAGLAAISTPASSQPAAARQVSQAAAAPRNDRTETRWRYVWHNDRWWYWTAAERWQYFSGRRWVNYNPRSPLSAALAAGYRKAPAFEKPPAAAPRPPHSWPATTALNESKLLNFFYFERRPKNADGLPPGSPSPSVLGGFGAVLGDRSEAARAYKGGGASVLPTPGAMNPPSPGGGGFGGPQGRSLGAGSAAGGASTPR